MISATSTVHFPVRGRYFMSQEQKDAVVGRLVRERNDAKKNLAMLQAEAREFSKLFTGLGDVVQPDNVWNIAVESYKPYLSNETYEKIAKLRAEIPHAQQELARLDGEMKTFE